MVLTEGNSFLVSSLLSLLTFSGMQVYKTMFASTQLMTVLGGFTGSLLFVFLLTGIGNLEKSMFGSSFQTQLSEVVFCLLVAMMASATIHRVCATTCFLFSILMVLGLTKLSNQTYSSVSTNTATVQRKKKN
ncbi:keratinocyte-associated protein 2 [Eurytemora carolleeae]|uniref:keratinocyte-associated protein 2 n=1 Tax=Eurytemora carolleeae TaxID=1294199 RepID=UPI000C762328|nr:keratinocyte-associated protein 2 [Eurytemora carolleeae]|eukprot:XP_023345939.1 keratinocyte-associated protein 2-like [Eurytemora affinis]